MTINQNGDSDQYFGDAEDTVMNYREVLQRHAYYKKKIGSLG